jgi:MATE family, multidrug efflux pump
MQDLTTGSLSRHLLKTTSFMLVTMVFQTLYFLIDLYWVGRLGKEAVAAVGIAGNLMFVVLAVTQMLAVGTTTLVSHAAVGRIATTRCSSSISHRCCRCWLARCSSWSPCRCGIST